MARQRDLIGDHRGFLVAVGPVLRRRSGDEGDRLRALALAALQRALRRPHRRVVRLDVADVDAAQRLQLRLRVGDLREQQLLAGDQLVRVRALILVEPEPGQLVAHDLLVPAQVARDRRAHGGEEVGDQLLDRRMVLQRSDLLDALAPEHQVARRGAREAGAERAPKAVDGRLVAAADPALGDEQLDHPQPLVGRCLGVVADLLDRGDVAVADRVLDQLLVGLQGDDGRRPAPDHARHGGVAGRALEREHVVLGERAGSGEVRSLLRDALALGVRQGHVPLDAARTGWFPGEQLGAAQRPGGHRDHGPTSLSRNHLRRLPDRGRRGQRRHGRRLPGDPDRARSAASR